MNSSTSRRKLQIQHQASKSVILELLETQQNCVEMIAIAGTALHI
jgi:hypothetical protein